LAEIAMFMTEADLRELVSLLVERFSARFEVDETPEATPSVLTTIDEVCIAVESNRFGARFAVVSPHWQRYPIYRHETERNDGTRAFFIDQRYGGPAFDFIANRPRTENGVRYVIPSSFSDYPYYFPDRNGSVYRTFDRPSPMAETYAIVQSHIRRLGVRTEVKGWSRPGPWVLVDALRCHREGLWLRTGEDVYIPRRTKLTARSTRTRARAARAG